MKNRVRELRTAAGMTQQQLAGLVLLLLLGGADMAWAFSWEVRLPGGRREGPAYQREKRLEAALTLNSVVVAAFFILLGTNLYSEKRM